MRKRQISPTPLSVPPSGQAWLDVDSAALVEVTSEENGFPIESALLGEKLRAGVRRTQERKLSASFSTSHNISDVSGWISRIVRIRARGSLFCVVSRRWSFISRNRASAVEFQSARVSTRDRGLRS